MHVLVTTHGIFSNLRGVLPLAEAIRGAGHDVAIGTAAEMKAEVERHNFRHIVAGYNWRPDMEKENDAMGGELGAQLNDDGVRYGLAARYFTGQAAYQTASALIEAAEAWRPDLIVRSWIEFGGYLAAETLGIPHVSLGISGGPAEMFTPERVAPRLADYREKLNLADDPSGRTIYRYRHLALVPEYYDPALAAIPNTVYYQHANPGRPEDQLPAGLLDRKGDRPMVFVSFGTLAPLLQGADRTRIQNLLHSVVDGLSQLDCFAVIASVNPEHADRLFRTLPGNVRLVGDLAAPSILEKCDLFVTHGGFNSVRESLSYGVPMVVVPLIAEQPYNAGRCAALGVAEVVPLPEVTPERILAACQRVLYDDSYAGEAVKLRDGIRNLPTLHAFADELEVASRAWRNNG